VLAPKGVLALNSVFAEELKKKQTTKRENATSPITRKK
jgi:hypothetical protein